MSELAVTPINANGVLPPVVESAPYPVGEYPDVTIAQAHQALDDLVQENEDLKAENLLLRAQLAESRDELAIAKVLSGRRGW